MGRIWSFLNQDSDVIFEPLAKRWIRFSRQHRLISWLPAIIVLGFMWYVAGWKYAVALFVAAFVVIPLITIGSVRWRQRRASR